ncbi:TPA: autotransporter domain-containing protein [Citrobacter koseri]|nr:autotransporter domain-containing protein [Citrobacter koseri]
MKRNTDKLRHKHLPLAIAISAILAGQAHAENISGVEDSTDKTYNKTVQWFPNGQGNSLTWNNVIASGGLEAKALDQNNISITESVLNGLKGIYIKQGMVNSGLNIQGSVITSEKDGLVLEGVTNSIVNISNTEVHAGSSGIWIPAAKEGSIITLDTVNIDSMNKGVSVSELNGSTLDIQNDSVITSAKDGLSLGSVTDSAVNISNTEVHAGGPGISVTAANNSDILVNGSYISSGEKDSGIYIKDLNGSTLNIQETEVHAGGPGIFIPAASNGSAITLDKVNIDSMNKGVSVSELNGSTLDIQNDSVITSAKDGLSLGSVTDSAVNISNTDITSSGGKGIRVNRMTNSELNIGDTVINNSGDLALYANLNNATATINNSEFSGGVKFTGHDGDINVSDFRANGFELDATNMNVDIDHADIGKLHISGQFSSEEDHKSLNEVNISGSKLTYIGVRFGSGIGLGNTINVSDSEIIATPEEDGSAGTAIHFQDTQENTINVKDSRLTGNIHNGVYYSDNVTEEAGNTDRHNVVNLDNTYFEGALTLNLDKIDGTTLPGLGSTVNMNNSTWVAKDESTGENVNITNSVVDITDATVNVDKWHAENTDLLVSSNSLLDINTGSGDMDIVIKSNGQELEHIGKEIISVHNGDMDLQTEDVDIGAYKYELVNQDGKWVLALKGGEENPDDNGGTGDNDNTEGNGNTGGNGGAKPVLSGSANAVLSGLAAPQASWNSQTSALYERLNSRLEQGEGSVWGAYYGNEWAGKAGLSSTFNQKISGVAIGADKTHALDGGTATFGAAVMHDYSHLSGFDSKGSGGSMDSTAVQAYGRLEMDNGLFFKGTAGVGRTSSSLHATSSDGAVARGDYRQT